MRILKKIILSFYLVIILSTSFQTSAYAANIFGVVDPPGCESKDIFLPNLVICGRSPASGACQAYTKACTLGDLVNTIGRAVIWIISIVLLIVPLLVMYYGAQMIIEQKKPSSSSNLAKIKANLWKIILYFILMLGAWLIIRMVVDIFQVEDRVPSFLIDENGNQVKARNFNTNN
jgi:hypothetical protein